MMFVVASAATADFTADLTLSLNVPDPMNILPGTPLVVTVTDTQTYGQNWWNNDITRIQLNWTASSAGLNLTTASTWVWDPVTNPLTTADDADMSDGVVNRQGAGIGIAPPSPFTVGTLSFIAPAYNPGGGNTYTLSLTGGTVEQETATAIADGDTYLLEARHGLGGGLTLHDLVFAVTPAGEWTGAATDHWESAANWSSGLVPDGSFQAILDASAPRQPALYHNENVKGVNFSTAGWTIGGAAFSMNVGTGGIDSAGSGTNTVAPAVALAASSIWTIEAGNTLALGRTLTLAGQTLTKQGPGTLLSAAIDGSAAGSALVIDQGDVVVTASGTNTVVVRSLVIDTADATLDLNDNNLVVDYTGASPLATIAAYLQAGFNAAGGYWDGTGISSASAAGDPWMLTALGIIDNADPTVGGKTTLDGTPVDPTSVLVKYTYWGDANLDGIVDSNDYDILDFNFLFPPGSPENPDATVGWWTGDLDYSGAINSNDYDKIDYAFLFQGSPLGAGGAPGGAAALPEPATLALLLTGLLTVASRRRRHPPCLGARP